MKQIKLSDPINLKELLESYNRSMNSMVCMQIGCDEKVYILLSAHVPERIRGMFVNTEANSNYSSIILNVDWTEGKVVGHTLVDLGQHKMNFHMIQPIREHILLLGARCRFRGEDGPEKNAAVVDFHGNVIRELCLGDGIQDCIVTKGGNIITSYFDEGVFGNYGWDNPIGCNGLIVWNDDGDIIWQANKDICDCYAMNLDDCGNLWYYYYTDFNLVKTDLKEETVYTPQIKGASGFLITSDMGRILFDGGYNKHGDFQTASLCGDKIIDYENVQLLYGDKYLLNKNFHFMKSKAIFLDSDNRLFAKWFIS